MLDRVVISSQPMLYVTTLCPARASTMASEVKASLATVRDFLTRRGTQPVGPPIVCYSDRDGRVVTIDAGYPVLAASASSSDGRVFAGRTPGGRAATIVYRGSPVALEAARARLNAQVAAEREHVTGLSWEIYLDGDGSGPANVTALYVQLLDPPVILSTAV
jgi:effector-binding domain-containing protein